MGASNITMSPALEHEDSERRGIIVQEWKWEDLCGVSEAAAATPHS